MVVVFHSDSLVPANHDQLRNVSSGQASGNLGITALAVGQSAGVGVAGRCTAILVRTVITVQDSVTPVGRVVASSCKCSGLRRLVLANVSMCKAINS